MKMKDYWIKMIEKISLVEKSLKYSDYWSPKIIASLNDSYVKVAKLKGEFEWHYHENEDELFFVIKGHLTIALRDQMLEIDPGELVVIPKNVEHKPMTNEEVEVLLIEPKSTLNTGNIRNERTVEVNEWI